jgi:hypothetical protein
VNRLLKDLPHDTDPHNRCVDDDGDEQDKQRLNDNEEDVKNATIDQLREMGISFHNPCRNDAPVQVRRLEMM